MDNFTRGESSRDALPIGYMLHWYELLEVIGRGGYGITYLAMDRNLQRKVAIKEYLPLDFACRNTNDTVHPVTNSHKDIFDWGLQRFLVEARTLARFNHPAIIRVVSVFEHNNTAYMVMEYEEGHDLATAYKTNAPYSEQTILDLFLPILEGLYMVHEAGFIHRDIKPSNIYVRRDGTSVLLDFGSARQTIGSRTRALTSLVTAGYAPFEQYNESEDAQGSWTDIYGLGATMYFCMTGAKPADAMERGSALLKLKRDIYKPLSNDDTLPYSETLKLAVDHALMFHAEERPQDARQWANMIQGKIEVPSIPRETENAEELLNFHTETTAPASNINTNDPLQLFDQNIQSSTPEKSPVSATAVANEQSQKQVAAQKPQNEPEDVTDLLDIGGEEEEFDDSTIIYQKSARAEVAQPQHQISRQSLSAEGVAIRADKELLQQAVMGTSKGSKVENVADKEKRASLDSIRGLFKNLLPFIQQNQKLLGIGASALVLIIVVVVMATTITIDSNESEEELVVSAGETPKDNADGENTDVAIAADPTARIEQATRELIEGLLTQAKLDMANNKILEPENDNAVFRYKKVLALQADHPQALEGLEIVTNRYVNLINSTIDTEAWDLAKQQINELKKITTDNDIIEPLQARLKDYEKQLQTIASSLDKADRYLNQNRLTRPKSANALYLYTKVLELDPENARANEGVNTILGKLSDVLRSQLQAGRISSAQDTYDKIEEIDAEAPVLKEAESKLTAVIQRRRSIGKLLESAKKDFIRGNLTTPRGRNAYTKYREVLSLSPRNKSAREGIDQIYGYYVATYYQAVDEGKFKKAKNVLSTLSSINYGKKQISVLSRILTEEKSALENEPETIRLMLIQLEKGLRNKDLPMVSNISSYKNKNEQFFKKLFNKYDTYSVRVMQTDHDLNSHRAKAKVKFSNLADDEGGATKNKEINIDISVSRNEDKEWKIVW